MTHILVTGASGRLGGAAVRSLLSFHPAEELHALVRTAAAADRLGRIGVDARIADYAHPARLAEAFRGIDRLLFVSSPVLDPDERLRQHRAVLAAAASIDHVVYTSVHGAEHDAAHAATEAALRERGGATVLRNGFYTEPFVQAAVEQARSGWIASATASRPLATASIADLAEAAARVVAAPPREELLELRGRAWTYRELADVLSGLLGHPVEHRDVPVADAGPFGPLHAAAAAGALAHETDDLRRTLGREPRGIGDVAGSVVGEIDGWITDDASGS
ncbi:NAD(P)H-binding protein [Leifsonia sp. NPDC080035]|uniref:NAD(P)H-binding protein n=1 Tax=Leifsonia sp. NPDC080035 TaxID=3143936 RepID=A0AAU7GCH9_9MICO